MEEDEIVCGVATHILDALPDIKSVFACQLCELPLEDPHSTPCGHVFCHDRFTSVRFLQAIRQYYPECLAMLSLTLLECCSCCHYLYRVYALSCLHLLAKISSNLNSIYHGLAIMFLISRRRHFKFLIYCFLNGNPLFRDFRFYFISIFAINLI